MTLVDPSAGQHKKAPTYSLMLILIGCALAVVGFLLVRSSSEREPEELIAASQKELILQLAGMYAEGSDLETVNRILEGWEAQDLANLFARVEVALDDPIECDRVADLRRALGLPSPQITHKFVLAQPAIIVASSIGILLILVAFIVDALPLVEKAEDDDLLIAQALAISEAPGGQQQPNTGQLGSQVPAAVPSTANQPAQPVAGQQPAAVAGAAQSNQPAKTAQPAQQTAQPGQAQAQPQPQAAGPAQPAGQVAQPPVAGQPNQPQPAGTPAQANQPQPAGTPAQANQPGAGQPAPQPDAGLLKPEEKRETNKDLQGILSDVFGEESGQDSELQTLTDGLRDVDIQRLSQQSDRLREILQRHSFSKS